MHVYDSAWPAVAGARLMPPDASVMDYRLLQERIGTRRAVPVTPSTYGTDNRGMLAALEALGQDARGVAVVDETVSMSELHDLHAAGVRGVRFNLSSGAHPPASALTVVAERIAEFGWHLQLLTSPENLLSLEPTLRSLPVALVLDHFGRIAPEGIGRAPHHLVLDLLEAGNTWVKVSGGYIVSALHRSDDPDLDALAKSYLRAAPERVVWGSDWPHATASAGLHPMPDDALQIEALARWVGSPAALQRVLVDNPRTLYGFDEAVPVSRPVPLPISIS